MLESGSEYTYFKERRRIKGLKQLFRTFLFNHEKCFLSFYFVITLVLAIIKSSIHASGTNSTFLERNLHQEYKNMKK